MAWIGLPRKPWHLDLSCWRATMSGYLDKTWEGELSRKGPLPQLLLDVRWLTTAKACNVREPIGRVGCCTLEC